MLIIYKVINQHKDALSVKYVQSTFTKSENYSKSYVNAAFDSFCKLAKRRAAELNYYDDGVWINAWSMTKASHIYFFNFTSNLLN